MKMKCKNCKEEEATYIFKDIETCLACLREYWEDVIKDSIFQDWMEIYAVERLNEQ